MITEKEQQSTLLSATKKDYYQIWNELLETAGKISERWDPSTTNESDPGIVLLKVLTGIADKLNYNIDKNILEAYMPSAAQEESMRKLCEMMGYAMKYYRSATTDVTIYYANDSSEWQADEVEGVATLILPAFTQITNIDKDIVYTTTEQASFTKGSSSVTVPCIEGTLNYCEQDNNNIVTINNLDDNNRYYLSSAQVAENGIFIYNISDSVWSSKWEQVDNLNSQELEKKIYKFGYDSKKFLPYIEFPSDISSLIADGLVIAYIVTNGLNGNISAKALSTFETPTEWSLSDSETYNSYNTTGVEHTADEFKCYNASAATNGADKESLNNAYKNFKKTVGTFDTLVTCRDYMNKIYTLVTSDIDTTPLVSNSIVSDIRDDINNAITLCTFDDCGIKYIDKSLTTTYARTVTGEDASGTEHTVTFEETKDLMDNFDLILYPFKTTRSLNTKTEYDNTFKNAGSDVGNTVASELAFSKTISHKLNLPDEGENTTTIMCIKNYLRLNAKISTATKVNAVEWTAILNNIKTAIYSAFNNRQLDFGEEIPFDDILTTIQNADTNIKNVSLEDPDLYTSFMTANNKEYLFGTADNTITDDDIIKKFTTSERVSYNAMTATQKTAYLASKRTLAKVFYNKLAVRNILAGRVALFNYNTDFTTTVAETAATGFSDIIYPTGENIITSLQPKLTINDQQYSTNPADVTLSSNQIVQFRAPNFKTSITYPAYVNYFAQLTDSVRLAAKPATFITVNDFIHKSRTVTSFDSTTTTTIEHEPFTIFMNKIGNTSTQLMVTITSVEDFNKYLSEYGVLFKRKTLYLYKEGLTNYNNINSHEVYVIPSLVTGDVKDTGITLGNFDGRIHKVAMNRRCDSTSPTKVNTTGNYLKIYDKTTENTITISAYGTILNLNKNIGTTSAAEATYYKLFTTEAGMKNTKVAANTIYMYEPTTTMESGETYYIYPLTSSSFAVWYNWIQSYIEYQYNNTYKKQLSGIYRNLGGDQSRNVGKMVDVNKNKYQLSTTWYTSSTSALTYYYVQQIHIGDKDTEDNIWGYTADGFGEDATYNTLSPNSEYQLKTGEYLCINYTNATSSVAEMTEDSTAATTTSTSEVINTYYGPGTIIRPNFALLNSTAKHATASYSKTENYDFSSTFGSTFKENVPGMFVLGSDEQIEIREPVSVYVYDETNTESEGFAPVYVYFNLNDNETVFLEAQGEDGSTRILEEGEYFWYTDKNKQTLTYCGAGCEIINHTNVQIAKLTDTDNVSTEDILSNGISIVPWIAVNNLFMKDPENPADTDLYIKWNEYQYINLVSSDVLRAVDNSSSASSYIALKLTNTWTNCKHATYICDNVASTLPELNVANMSWQARTKLAITINPDYSQTLSSNTYTSEQITATQTDSSGTSIDSKVFKDVSLKSNYTVNSTADKISTTYNLYNEDNKLIETITDFKLKAFETKTLYTNVSTTQPTVLSLNNMNNYYTSFNFEDCIVPSATLKNISPFTKIYSMLVDGSTNNNYNLIMFYYQTNTTDTDMSKYVHIRTLLTSDNSRSTINKVYTTIFNYSTQDTWWSGRTYTRTRQFANVLEDSSGVQFLKQPTSETEFTTLLTNVLAAGGTLYPCTVTTTPETTVGYNIAYGTTAGKYYLINSSAPATSWTSGTIYVGVDDLGYNQDTFYCLRPGINILKISGMENGVIEIYPGEDLSDTITFGQLDTITVNGTGTACDLGLNLDLLGYQSEGTDTTNAKATNLLAKLRTCDPDNLFYYNTKIDGSLDIDINSDAGETLSDEVMWYDYNNTNNKFVVSEIDSDYIDTGITLARSSSK